MNRTTARPVIEIEERDGWRIAHITRLDGSSYDVRSRIFGRIYLEGDDPPPGDAIEGLCDALIDELQADLYGHEVHHSRRIRL